MITIDATAKGEREDAEVLSTMIVDGVSKDVQDRTLVRNLVDLGLKDIVYLPEESQKEHLLVQIDGGGGTAQSVASLLTILRDHSHFSLSSPLLSTLVRSHYKQNPVLMEF